jgi:hypothetical protein
LRFNLPQPGVSIIRAAPHQYVPIASAIAPVPLENAEIELVEGYSTPGKLVEIEVTARR